MKTRITAIALMLSAFALNAQEQAGVVKTIGRPGKPGTPIEDVSVRAKGSPAVSVSDDSGNFMITLAHYADGQAYSLSRVFKYGYNLADEGIIGRSFPYSADIPLEISMISEEDYNRTKKEIEAQVRSRMEKEYQDQLKELNQQLEKKSISEEMLQKKHTELLDYYDNIENLVQELADRYARTDYDHLDSLDQQINQLIEQGRLEEAEALIEGKQTKQELEKIKASNAALAQALEEGKEAEAKKTAEYADELQKRFEIAAMRYDNKAAAAFLKQRMELDPSNVAWKLKYAIFICDYLGSYDEALEVYQSLLQTVQENHVIATIYGCMGKVYDAQGKLDESLEACMNAAALREGDPSLMDDLATSYSNIASCYITKDMFDKGLEYLEKAKALYETQQDSLGIAGIYTKSAIVQHKMGNFIESTKNFHLGLNIKIRHLGATTLEVASSYSSLAATMKDQGQYSEAFNYLNKAIDIRQKILGENHPGIANLYLSLGSLEIAAGKNDNALRYYEYALEMLKKFHTGKHPDIARAYNQMAYYYSIVSSDLQKALEYYTLSGEMTRSIYGELHSDYAIFLNNIGITYSDMAEYDNAIEYYNKAYKIWVYLFGEKHYSIANYYNQMGMVFDKLDRKEEALVYFEKALQININYYGEDHILTGKAYNNLGGTYANLGKFDKALESYEKACDIYLSVLGSEHQALGKTFNNMGALYLKKKMYEQSDLYINKALDIFQKTYDGENIDIAICYVHLGVVNQMRREYDKAAKALENAYKLICRIYGERHPQTASVLANMTTLYSQMKQYDKAIECCAKSIDIAQEFYPQGHEITLAYKSGLADIYSTINQYDKAIPYLLSAFYDSLKRDAPNDGYASLIHKQITTAYIKLLASPSYTGEFAQEMAELNTHTIITATVAKDSAAEEMGLSGTYQVVAYQDWTLADTTADFFTYKHLSDSQQYTYILHRDGEFVKIPFEGRLGIYLNSQLISAEEKEAIAKAFKKWHRKNR